MKVEWQRRTNDGGRSVLVTANDIAQKPSTIREWIKMLRAAEIWLGEAKTKEKAGE